jgi:hypothetical protein
MLRLLLVEELAIFALRDVFHYIILGCWLAESVHECFANDRAPSRVRSTYTTMNVLKQLYAFFSRGAPHHHAIGALSI